MELKQLEDLTNEVEGLHRSMKNMMEIVFEASPLLVLSTSSRETKFINSRYLLRVSGVYFFFAISPIKINRFFNHSVTAALKS